MPHGIMACMVAQSTGARALRNKKGVTLYTLLSDKEAFNTLEKHVEQGHGTDFARDLVFKGQRHGLSEEQFWWVHKMANDIVNPPKPLMLTNIANRFTRARDRGVKVKDLKAKIGSVEVHGQPRKVELSYATGRSRYPGSVWVNIPEVEIYCGRIDTDGTFFRTTNCPDEVVTVLLKTNDEAAWTK